MDNDRDMKQQTSEHRESMRWQPFVQTLLATCALVGAGIGGMLHFLNVGEGHPAYQIFVLRLSAFVLIIIFFFLVLANIIVFLMEFGRLDRKHADIKYVRYVIRSFTIVFTLMLAVSAYGIFFAGTEFFARGLQEYIQVLRTAKS
ncbi:hypothetical protein EN41_05315 [Agrobacterium tumefaciens]|uniref:Orf_Bo172 n=3 Tax=Agrobacterium TaxID=357 RepID=A5WY88_AGRTU|nr:MULTISPECIES: hypothetical protein [Rhizobium/Agrobacterium group]AAZ50556.1 orf_Bo172 [Agrobacterium tumefaciens]ASK40919.1 hypothetical protein [Agrobacterium genomosp. 6]ASK42497.1 hypothetical protein [Agrobacterium sp.]ASK49558.1 protein virD3 [Agrobacterium larrymoorei]KEY51607.1 hypothetical protein EN41_05315 [Agrobacterium tumefaciens]